MYEIIINTELPGSRLLLFNYLGRDRQAAFDSVALREDHSASLYPRGVLKHILRSR
jgi:hypothetical protein